MLAFLFTLLLVLTPARPADSAPCDSLYAAAEEARAEVISGKGKVRSTPEERHQWRQTVRRLLSVVDSVRACYGPLPSTSGSISLESEEGPLPAPSSTVRQRLMQTYQWGVLAHRELQQYEAAFQEYEAFFQRFGAISDSSRISFMYNSRGYLQYRLGSLTEAINDYMQTLAYTPATDTLDRADLMIDLGTILQKANDLRTARQYYAQAERLVPDVPLLSNPQREVLARALFNQGDVLLQDWPGDNDSLRSARHQHAIDLLQQAIDLHPDGWEILPKAHIILGEAYTLAGNFEAAFRHLRRGRQLAETVDATTVHQTDVLALAALARGKAEAAANRLDAASASLKEAIHFAELGNHHHFQLDALQKLGELYERRNETARAETYYRRAIAVTEELRASLRATDWATGAFSEWVKSHRGLVRVLAAQEQYRKAFQAMERTRARHLQDVRLQARITSTLPPSRRVRFDSLTTALTDTRTRLTRTDLSEDEAERLRMQETQLMAKRRSLIELNLDFTPPPLADLQTHLRTQNQTLISFFIDAPPSGQSPHSFAFVVTPDSLHAVPLTLSTSDLDQTLREVSPMLDSRVAPGTNEATISTTHFDLKVLHHLHEQLIAPLAETLPAEGRLAILPDGPLFRLPFSMLVTKTSGRFAYDDAQYLIEDHPVATDLSTALLTDTSAAPRSFQFDLIALGHTRFSEVALPSAHRSAPDSSSTLPSLPGIEREVQALRNLFGRRRILLNDAATESAFYDFHDTAKVLHLASHALIDETNPRNNLFVLTSGAAQSDHDGLLFLHELERHRAQIPLVVLSGCSTARGIHRSGEGPLGLQYAFRAMGAQSTLSTLWPTDDAAVSLTTSFYRHLQNGAPKDVALQRAQVEALRTDAAKASPFFWASPVLYGNTRPLHLRVASGHTAYLIGGAFLILALLGYAYRQRGAVWRGLRSFTS